MGKKSDGLFEAFMGRKRDERVNIFGFVPKTEKQRVRQLHAAERTAKAVDDLAKSQKAGGLHDEVTEAGSNGKAITPLPPPRPLPAGMTLADHATLRELAGRRNDGEITVAEFEKRRAAVISEVLSRVPAMVDVQAVAAGPSLATELERLAALHSSGNLSDDEFQSAKRRLIER